MLLAPPGRRYDYYGNPLPYDAQYDPQYEGAEAGGYAAAGYSDRDPYGAGGAAGGPGGYNDPYAPGSGAGVGVPPQGWRGGEDRGAELQAYLDGRAGGASPGAASGGGVGVGGNGVAPVGERAASPAKGRAIVERIDDWE